MIDAIQFLTVVPDASILYVAHYHKGWVFVSVLLAILTSYAALTASVRANAVAGKASQVIWILISALALGVGTWAMHFVGMLALRLPCGISYNPIITLLSMIPSLLAGGVVFGFVWHHQLNKPTPLFGSVLLGSGIGTMHYTGMAAMQLEGVVRYDPKLFVISIVVAVVLSYIALRVNSSEKIVHRHRNVFIAVILGGAVSGMHYTAMAATYFVKGDADKLPATVFTPDSLAVIVVLATVFLAFSALVLAALSHAREVTSTLKLSEERFRYLLDHSPIAVRIAKAAGHEVVFSNRRYGELIALDSATGVDPASYYAHKQDYEDILSTLAKGQQITDKLIELNIPTYGTKWTMASYLPILFENEKAVLGWFYDITDQKLAENQLRVAAIAFESQEGKVITDTENNILKVNHAFTKITGYVAEEVIGKNPKILKSGRQDKHFYAAMWDCLNTTGTWKGEIWNRRKNGEVYPEYLTISTVKNTSGIVVNHVATFTDNTQNRAATAKIDELSFYDSLTKLPNRQLLLDRLNQALASRKLCGNEGALMFIDLDDFKTLNDTLGHDVGDLLLMECATRISNCIREGDTVARLGGDEFVVLLENLSTHVLEAAAQVEDVAEKIIASLSEPYLLNAYECQNTASIGVVLFDDHNNLQEVLFKHADIALYQAKKAGRNRWSFFDPHMQDAIVVRADLVNELRKAIDKQQFQLHYQIQVNQSGQAIGAEALIRWPHPERGMISPFHFISLAEETGLILPIGQWVLETACAQLAAWQHHATTRDLTLSVNVSARQFRQVDFVEKVQKALHHSAADPTKLKLELTESLLVDNVKEIVVTMNALKALGIKFSLDDFGTGYSSLQYLKQLPLDQLKIDQSFVRDLVDDDSDKAIVLTVITMANSLGLNVIAEGVETKAQRQFLLDNKCENYQGYLFSKPVPIDEFEALLEKSESF